MNAVILSIGHELICGQTVDTNTAWLSARLAERGVRVLRHVTIADELEPICSAITAACRDADVVLISGGLGPTADDLTRQALAAAMGAELVLHDVYVERIRAFFDVRGRSMPPANIIQAHFPAGSEPIDNSCGTAPGIRAFCGRATVFAVPGVPGEMREMYERDIAPWLAERCRGAVLLAVTLHTFGMGESDIAEKIADLMRRGCNPTVGTTAKQGMISIRVHAHGASVNEARRLLDETVDEIRGRLGLLIFGQDDETLAGAVGLLLTEQKKTLATAESCTGGLIAKLITDVAGSSAYFLQGLVTYANEAKTSLVDVSEELLIRHGAVSERVAEAMALGCRQRSGADFTLSVTGIAGPGGGTDQKPVGLVYIGLADASGVEVTEPVSYTHLRAHET